MLAHYEEKVAGRPWARERIYADRLNALRDGEPLVLPGWELARYEIPVVRRGVHAFYRVEPDGRVVEVTGIRDPKSPMSITGYEEVS